MKKEGTNGEKKMSMKKINQNLNSQLRSSVIIISLVFVLVYSLIAYNLLDKHMIDSKQELLLQAVNIASGQIDGDLHATLAEGDEETEVYNDLISSLRTVKEQSNLTYLYSFKLDGNRIEYVLDTDLSENQCSIGDSYDYLDSIGLAFEGTTNYDPNYTEEDGEVLLSAFAPIYNSVNKVVGVVGADLEISDLLESQRNYLILFIVIGIVGMGFAMVVSVWLSNKVKEGLSDVTNNLNKNAANLVELKEKLADEYSKLMGLSDTNIEYLSSMRSVMDDTNDSLEKGNAAHMQIGIEIDKMNQLIKEVNEKAFAMKDEIEKINISSKEMVKLTSLINGISTQTSMLAINAAVEAARAGDAGRGFAVVADEVGSLSSNTAEALTSIDKMIDENIANTEKTAISSQELLNCITDLTKALETFQESMAVLRASSDNESANILNVFQSIQDIEKNDTGVTVGLKDNMAQITQLNDCSIDLTNALDESNRYLGLK